MLSPMPAQTHGTPLNVDSEPGILTSSFRGTVSEHNWKPVRPYARYAFHAHRSNN